MLRAPVIFFMAMGVLEAVAIAIGKANLAGGGGVLERIVVHRSGG